MLTMRIRSPEKVFILCLNSAGSNESVRFNFDYFGKVPDTLRLVSVSLVSEIFFEIVFRDESLANTCIEHCADRFDECNASCSNQFNSTCTYECNLDYFDCQNLCPCFPGCPDGCYQCQTSFCQCQDKPNSPDFITCKVKFLLLVI